MGTHPIFESDFDCLTENKMDRLKSVFGGATSQDSNTNPVTEVVGGENQSLCPSLSFQNRMFGFGVCTGVGIMLSIGGSINMFFGNYTGFGVLYSLGTIISLVGSGFLRGPVKQIKALTDTNRLIAVLIMFLMIILTILASVVWKIPVLALIFCLLQFLSYCWYCLSYIPYGRDAVTGCFKSCV